MKEDGGVATAAVSCLPAVINDVSKINDYASLFVSAAEEEEKKLKLAKTIS